MKIVFVAYIALNTKIIKLLFNVFDGKLVGMKLSLPTAFWVMFICAKNLAIDSL